MTSELAVTPREASAAAAKAERGLAHIVTMGCQMNVHDSERLAGMLERMGFGFTDEVEASDLILFNTCAVRENPERKLYGQVERLKALKEAKPGLKIGICGCVPQQRHELGVMKERLPYVDLIFGTHNLHQLPELLERAEATDDQVVEVWHEEGNVVEGLPVRREGELKAFVNIIYGCNYHCTYCIVPSVRGKERSRQPGEIEEEVRHLVRDGYKEVMLLGQNVDAYGKDLGTTDLANLLWRLDHIPGIERLRFMTSHPKDISDRLIDVMAVGKRVCEHLHLPVQAGSDRILKRMGRRYTRERYLEIVEEVRRRVPGISLTTDIIVGFPGETDDDFEQTMNLVESVQFDAAYTFIYSPRHGTAAPRLPDPVPEKTQRERIYRLIDLQNEISLRRNEELVHETVEVLVEGPSPKDPNQLTGRTRTNKTVIVDGSADLVGACVPVEITKAKAWTLFGRLVR